MTNMPTLICLVSEQRMQNVIPLFQRGLSFDRVVLVASSDNGAINPRFIRIAQDLEAALCDRAQWMLWKQPVDPMEPARTLTVCEDIIHSCGGPDTVTINFTGGTKPMSIGAYQAGLSTGCAMLYVDTQKEQIFCYKSGTLRTEPFHLEPITVAQVLTAHGKPINMSWTVSKQPSEVEGKLTEKIFISRNYLLPQVIAMQKVLRLVKLDGLFEKTLLLESVQEMDELLQLLERCGEARQDGLWLKISHRMARYFDGSWLEQYVNFALQQDGRFDDVNGNLQLTGVENELDVACTRHGKLAIVECKSGRIDGGEGASVMNRLRALKESIAGTFGKTFLVTSHALNKLSSRFLDRANEYVSRVIGLEHLPEVERLIYEEIADKRR